MDKNNKIYEKFFRENELVLSSYFSVHWCLNGFGNLRKQINIFSKIPFKIYIGINQNKSKQIIFNDIYVFKNKDKIFEKIDFYDLNKKSDKLIEFLENNLKNFLEKSGYKINILIELERGHGYGITGMIGSLVISGIFYLNKKIENNNFKINEILKKSREFEKISKKGNSIGEASYGSFLEHNKLFLQSYEKNIDIYKKFYIDYEFDLPFDYYIIFSGIKSDTLQIENIRKNLEKNDNFKNFIKDNLGENYSFGEKEKIAILPLHSSKIGGSYLVIQKKKSLKKL